MGDDYIDAESDEFFSKLLGTIAPPVGIAELDLDVLAFRIPECMQSAPEAAANGCGDDADTSTPTRGNFAGCCALAASGHAVAPPSSVMNSRRFNRFSCIRVPPAWCTSRSPPDGLPTRDPRRLRAVSG